MIRNQRYTVLESKEVNKEPLWVMRLWEKWYFGEIEVEKQYVL